MNVDEVDKVTEVDKSANIEYCQCGKSNDIENLNAKIVIKSFVRIVQLVL